MLFGLNVKKVLGAQARWARKLLVISGQSQKSRLMCKTKTGFLWCLIQVQKK